MAILSQLLGITGVIVTFYALLAFAVTQASGWFIWTLLGTGLAFIIIFVITSLNRVWQAVVGLFVAFNIPWLAVAFTRKSDFWEKIIGPGGFQDKTWFSSGITTLAFVLNALFLVLAWRLLKKMFQKRSLRYGASSAVYSVVAVAIILVANVVSADFHWQKDFTANQINMLTEQSVKAISNLHGKLTITAFLDDRNAAKQGLKDLLGQYQAKSKSLAVDFVDPDKERVLAQKFNAKDGDILVAYGTQTHITKEMTEQGITDAILKVVRTTNSTACFTRGHGELDIDAPDDNPRSLAAVKSGFENEGIKAKGVDSILGGVPEDCSMLIVAGPTQQFTPQEASAVDAYLEKSGHAIFLLDPNLPDPRMNPKKFVVLDTGLEEIAKKWGVDVGFNLIVQSRMELFRGVITDTQVSTSSYGNHPIVDSLKGRQTVFDRVRSVRKAEGFSGTAVELIFSAGNKASVAVSDIDTLVRNHKLVASPKDIPGPVPIAIAVEKENADASKKKTQLVVFGDSDFASNAMVRSYEFNYDVILNAASWLSGTTQQIAIRPKLIRSSTIDLTPEQTNIIFYIAIIGIPMLVLIFGMDLWWYRRRRG